jgi:hypothetical protein
MALLNTSNFRFKLHRPALLAQLRWYHALLIPLAIVIAPILLVIMIAWILLEM